MNLNELRDEAYATAKANGWHEQEYSDEHYLMLIITEVAEAVQADRNNRHADVAKFKEYQTYYGFFCHRKKFGKQDSRKILRNILKTRWKMNWLTW